MFGPFEVGQGTIQKLSLTYHHSNMIFFQSLVDAMMEQNVDLIVLEGMGRAIHTNLYARFQCETLKVAVLKNRWLAQRLGGEMFAVIFKYENAQII